MKHALLIALLLAANPAQANERLLVVSIKPVHSLVETLVAGTDIHAKLLVGGTASLHSMSLKPSQLDMIGKADAVIFISETLESFLTPILRQHPQMKAIALENADRLTRYPPRRGDGHDDDHTGSTDMHVWASPTNAMAMAAMLVNELSAIYPERAVIIAANAKYSARRPRIAMILLV